MTRMTRSLFCFLSALAFLGAISQAKDPAFKAVLKPNRTYESTITRSFSGNTGFQTLVPVQTKQDLVITTGSLEREGLPVDLRVFGSRNEADLAFTKDKGTEIWHLSFHLRNDGSITGLTILSGERGVDPIHAETVALRYLGDILLSTDIKAQGLQDMTFRDPRKKKGKPGITEVTCVIAPMAEEKATTGEEKALAVQRAGSAQFDTAEQFFTEFSIEETSKIYPASDGEEDGAREIVSVQRTRVLTRITAK